MSVEQPTEVNPEISAGDLYKVTYKRKAKDELQDLREKYAGRSVVAKLDRALANLVHNPRPEGCKKLNAVLPRHSVYRLRITYRTRVIYAVHDDENLVIVGRISDREDINYNDLGKRFIPSEHGG